MGEGGGPEAQNLQKINTISVYCLLFWVFFQARTLLSSLSEQRIIKKSICSQALKYYHGPIQLHRETHTHALHAYAPVVPQVIVSQEVHVSLSDIPDLPEGSNITIMRTFPCVFQG